MIRLLILKELKDRLRKRRALSSPQQSVVNYVNYYWLLSAPILQLVLRLAHVLEQKCTIVNQQLATLLYQPLPPVSSDVVLYNLSPLVVHASC